MCEEMDVFERLRSTSRLPSPLGVAARVLELANADDVSLQELAKVIGSDPVLSARILKFVNSSVVGVSREVSTVTQAVVLMGLRSVKMLSLSFSLVSFEKETACPSFDFERFWSRSLACAVAARSIAERTKKYTPDEAFVAGLLSRIGQLALADGLPAQYDQVLQTALNEPCDLAVAEHRIIGMTHTEIGARLLKEWRLPEALCSAVVQFPKAAESQPDGGIISLAHLLYTADLAASIMCDATAQDSSKVDKAVCAVHKLFSIDRTEWVNMFAQIAHGWQEYCQLLAIQAPEVTSLINSVSELIETEAQRQIADLSLATPLESELKEP